MTSNLEFYTQRNYYSNVKVKQWLCRVHRSQLFYLPVLILRKPCAHVLPSYQWDTGREESSIGETKGIPRMAQDARG